MKKAETDTVKFVEGLVARSRKALKEIESYSQERVDELVLAVAWGIGGTDKVARELATLAFEETQLGDIESKVVKVMSKARSMTHELKSKKSVGIIEDNKSTGLMRIAKPIGVIASLVPSTQPEMHPLVQALNVIKAKDAIIFSPHPRSKKTSVHTVNLMRAILKSMGAPEDILICAENPTLEISHEIMRQCDLIIATGGSPMVKAAQSLGRPAYGVGAGNAIMVVDESADLKDTAEKIKTSKIFDLAAGCSCDNSIVIHESIYDEMLEEFKKVGAYLASPEEKDKIQKALWPEWPAKKALNRDMVCRPITTIAKLSDISVPADTSFILVEERGIGAEYPFAGEKMCLVLTIYKYSDFDEALNIVNVNQAYSGAGHSCGIYSTKRENILRMAKETFTTRVNINLPNSASNTGNWFNKMPSTSSLGCGSWGQNIISENLSLKHYLNTTWVISAIPPVIPTDEDIFGELASQN